jgi:hypothetical protein
MATRLIITEVPDTKTQDDIERAIAIWNADERRLEDNRIIKVVQQTSLIVGN